MELKGVRLGFRKLLKLCAFCDRIHAESYLRTLRKGVFHAVFHRNDENLMAGDTYNVPAVPAIFPPNLWVLSPYISSHVNFQPLCLHAAVSCRPEPLPLHSLRCPGW